jgi:hypothetical protein
MGLREEIEAALATAAAEGGVRQLAIDGDEEVWVAGLGVTDGTLELRVGDRGPRRGLRRRRPDRTVMAAQRFRDPLGDAWILSIPPSAGQAARAAAAAVSALVDGLGVPAGAHASVFFTQRGATDLVAAADAIANRSEDIAFVGAPGEATVVTLIPAGDRVRVQTLWANDKPLDLPGFDHDDGERLSTRDVEPEEAVAAARMALDAHGVDSGGPLLIHLGG